MKICITGGAGMIGSRLTKRLLAEGHSIQIIDNLWRGKLENIANLSGFNMEHDFFNIDLSNPENQTQVVSILSNADAVIHLADIVAGIGYVFNNQYEIFRINNLINTNLFNACAKAEVKKIIYAGTACSFPKDLQMSLDSELKETQLYPAEPESAYGWSKLMGSLELQFMQERYGMQTTTLMLHNVYGPNCDIDPKTSQVIPSIIRKIVELPEGGTLDVWGSGNQGRAFMHVDEICNAFVAALNKENLPPIIQIGPNQCTSIKELVQILVNKIANKKIEIHYDLTKPEGDKGRFADYSLAKEVLGWEPSVSLEDGLRETYQWVSDLVKKQAIAE